VPQDRELVAQEFLLLENSGSDDLEDVTDSQFSLARFTIKVPFIDAISYTGFIQEAKAYFLKTYPEARVWETGMVSLFVQVITSAIISLRESYLYAMMIITILMIFLIGRIRIGLLSMIPNLTPILIMLGIMGWFDISMNLFSMLVASISIGLAVDDAIHFMHNFRRYFEESNDAEKAVLDTLHSTGRAMSVTTCVLSIGFFTFMFASMKNLFDFGMLTGITIGMALLADFFIAPSLMIVANRKK
jgi:predicted RND superfamily exporter protein